MPTAIDPIIYLCERSDIIERAGKSPATTQIADPLRTGTYDTTILDLARKDASSDVMAAAGNRCKIWLETTIPQWIVKLTAERAVYYAWFHGSAGKAVPEEVKVRCWDNVEKALDNLRKGETGPGYGETPTRYSPSAAQRDPSDGGRRFVYSSFGRSGWR